MNWHDAYNIVRQHVVRIQTPKGYGTGFLAFYNRDRSWCGIATAAHLVTDAAIWRQPIRMWAEAAPIPVPATLMPEDRMITLDGVTDVAVVSIPTGVLPLPEKPLAMIARDEACDIGTDVGWLACKSMEFEIGTLCFFRGTVSTVLRNHNTYLLDGLVVDGASGGPVFHCPKPGQVQIVGSVSAYRAERANGESLPGLVRAYDLSGVHDEAAWAKRTGEKEAKQRVLEQTQSGLADTFPSSPLLQALRGAV